jgi:hypothetical protein
LTSKKHLLALSLPLALGLTACRQDMHDQPKYKPYAESRFWNDSRSARPIIDGTVARGYLKTNTKLYKGKEGDAFLASFPSEAMEGFASKKAFLERGQQRYNIYCTPCHGRLGDGEGMVVQRGFKHPPTYHQDRLRNQTDGYMYDVISNGFGSMISYASRIPVKDRWAIVAYIRVLQYSQNAPLDAVPASERESLDHPKAASEPAGHGEASSHGGGHEAKGEAKH